MTPDRSTLPTVPPKVGGVYRDRHGNEVSIRGFSTGGISDDGLYPYYTADRRTYTGDGRFCIDEPDGWDLVEVISEPGEAPASPVPKFRRGDRVRKLKGAQWRGRVVGEYSTRLTPEGYAVESEWERGSVQIYPAAALEIVEEDA